MSDRLLYLNDHYRPSEEFIKQQDTSCGLRVNSKVEFFNDSGELIWEPLHNKTVIAGSALTAMKLFNLDRSVLDATPTYESEYMLSGLVEGNNNGRSTTNDYINKIGVKNNVVLSQELYKNKLFMRRNNDFGKLKIEKSIEASTCCVSCT